jgi:hypothetical protein
MRCELMMPESDIQTAAMRATMGASMVVDRRSPPYSTGMIVPKSPIDFICSTMATGYSSACSRRFTCGRTSVWRKLSMAARISASCSASVLMGRNAMSAALCEPQLERRCRSLATDGKRQVAHVRGAGRGGDELHVSKNFPSTASLLIGRCGLGSATNAASLAAMVGSLWDRVGEVGMSAFSSAKQ